MSFLSKENIDKLKKFTQELQKEQGDQASPIILALIEDWKQLKKQKERLLNIIVERG